MLLPPSHSLPLLLLLLLLQVLCVSRDPRLGALHSPVAAHRARAPAGTHTGEGEEGTGDEGSQPVSPLLLLRYCYCYFFLSASL